jgi:two-component system chemotaxis response regulator CheB
VGAVEVLAKPAGPYSIGELSAVLAQKVRAAAQSVIRQRGAGERRAGVTAEASSATSEARRQDQGESLLRVNPAALRRHLVAIGSSTGGTQAIEALLGRFSGDCPAMVIVQHIPAGFSRAFADRLNACLPMEVKEASPGDEIRFGRVLIAPGNFHLVVERGGSGYRVGIKDGPLVCYQRPSVDVMFRSVANVAGEDCVAAILTGMGSDGAQGMKRVREAGGWTIAQDEASCVVYGMPREAVKVGAVEESAPLEAIPERILAGLAKAPGRNGRLSSTRLA